MNNDFSWLKEIYYEDDNYILGYDEFSNAVVMDWKKEPVSAIYKEALEKLLEAMKHYKCVKTISFIENMGAVSEETQQFTIMDWFPRAMAIGYVGLSAMIQPESIFSQLSMDMMVDMSLESNVVETQTPMRYFPTNQLQEAREWLKNAG